MIIAALGGANMLMTGVIGLYVGRIYAEAKGRPLYIVERAVGFEDAPRAARRPTPTVNSSAARESREGPSVNSARNQAAEGSAIRRFWPMSRRPGRTGVGATGPLMRDVIATARVLRFTVGGAPRSGR